MVCKRQAQSGTVSIPCQKIKQVGCATRLENSSHPTQYPLREPVEAAPSLKAHFYYGFNSVEVKGFRATGVV